MTKSGRHLASPVLQLLQAERPRFLAFLRGRLRGEPQDAAEEILQDVQLKLWLRPPLLREATKVEAWLYRTLRNAATDYYRRGATYTQALEEFSRQPRPAAPGHICPCASRELAQLKPEYSQALRQIEMDEDRVEDFAQSHGLTANSASVRLHRARKALRRRMEQACAACDGCFDCTCPA